MATHSAQANSASGLNVLLGCWLIVSPWIFGYTLNVSGFWNSIAAGILIALLAVGRFSGPFIRIVSSWWNLLLGLWAIASPWIYGYGANSAAMWDCTSLGILVALLASWSGGITIAEAQAQHPTISAPR